MTAHIHFNISTPHLLPVNYFLPSVASIRPPANVAALGMGQNYNKKGKFEVDSFGLNSILQTKGGVLNTCYEIWK
jgi:hypothetical protein